MDTFRTEVLPAGYPWKLSYHSDSFFIGSCFTQHIGVKMRELKFRTEINPFGVVYNPLSVKNSLEILLQKREFSENDLQFNNHRWFSFYHHSSFSHTEKSLCLSNINSKIISASRFLYKADFLFITFGTARVFTRNETGKVVSNCHKLPSSDFTRRLLTVDEIVKEYSILFKYLFDKKPDLKVILTLSPIRHWKDGAEGNQISKATLILAINQLIEMRKNVFYFPSYEIMMDDLRDYRYYADDMIHLSPLAINYIWEKFSKSVFDLETLKLIPRIQKINKALSHTPFDASSKSYKNFARKTLDEINTLERENQFLEFTEEKDRLLELIKVQ